MGMAPPPPLRFLYKQHTTAASAVSPSELCSARERDRAGGVLPCWDWGLGEMATVPPLPWPPLAVSVRRSLQEGAAGAASYSYAQAQRAPQQGAARSATTARSVETLVVIVAAIVLAAVLAGVLARVCGGRHVTPSAQYHDEEGWVERRCRSCLDSGLPPPEQGSSKTSEAK